MPLTYKKQSKNVKKDPFFTDIRKKLGVTQEQLSNIFGVSRAYITMAESGKRNLHTFSNSMLANIYLQFHELETGRQLSYRTLETNLFLNAEYRKILPRMKHQENDCRFKLKELKKEMAAMKERARDAEHAIIVFTSVINSIQENNEPLKPADETKIYGLSLLKQQAYDKLLTCWEPEQAKLHGKIEAIAGEARALRRYRIKVMNEHHPIKDGKGKG